MKRFFLVMAAVIFALTALVGCTEELKEFTGLKFENREFVYDGQIKMLNVENLPEGAQVVYEGNSKSEIGVYTVTAHVSKEGYKTITLSAVLTIKEGENIPPSADEFFRDVSFVAKTTVYDGLAKSLEATNLPQGTFVTYEGNNKINAGEYTVKALLKNGEYEKTLTAVLKIDKAAGVISSEDRQVFVYDGGVKSVAALLNHSESELEFDKSGLIEAGTYTVKVTAPQSANYTAVSKTVTLVIEKAKPNIIAEDVYRFVYDGTVKNVTATADVNAENLVIEQGKIDAGNYQIKVEVRQSNNYEYVFSMITLIIEKAESIITADEIQTFLYDGTQKRAAATINHSESVPESGYKIDAGEYSVNITVAESANYKAARKTVTIKILPNLEMVTFTDKTVRYIGNYQGIQVSGLQSGMSVVYSGNRRLNVGSNIAYATVTIDQTGENKKFSAVFTVEKAPLSVKVNDEQIYLGRQIPNFSARTVGLLGADNISSLGTLTFICDADANTLGEYPIIAEGLQSDNYEISYQSGTLSVIRIKTDLIEGGLHLNADGKTVFNREEINWLGVNFYPMINGCFENNQILESRVYKVLASLETLADFKVKVIRFNLGFFYTHDWGKGYFENPQAYYDLLLRIFDKAAECNIGLVPSFFWTSYLLDYFGEQYVPAFDNAASNDSKTLAFMLQFTKDVVSKFASHPAIMMWEFGNEYNLSMDLPNWSEQPGNAGKDPAINKPTLAIHTQIIKLWAKTVRENDPYERLIGSGDAEYRASNYHQHIENSWRKDTYDEHMIVLGLYHPEFVDGISIHVYGNSSSYSEQEHGKLDGLLDTKNWKERLALLVEMSAKLKKSCYVGEAGFSYSNVNKINMTMLKNHYKAIIDAVRSTKVPMIMFWNYDPNSEKVDGDLVDRGSGTEYSWNENWEKGNIILSLIKENS